MIESNIGESDFFANKIRMKFRKTEPLHVAWCDAFKKTLTALMEFIKEHHKEGLKWNAAGGSATSFTPPAAAPAAAAKKAPAAAGRQEAGGIGALGAALAEKAKGGLTSGLKTVGKDQQTWRKEFAGGDAPKKVVAKAPKPSTRPGPKMRGPPVLQFQQQGMKWCVENHTGDNGVVTVELDPNTSKKHMVFIGGCHGATIDIKGGSCKGVFVEGCTKSNIIFGGAISAFEIANCQRMKVQCNGSVPTVSIDKTDGILVYLTADCAQTVGLVTAKSSEMNVTFPNKDGDYIELPIPEQFQHKLVDVTAAKPKLTSDVSELYSSG